MSPVILSTAVFLFQISTNTTVCPEPEKWPILFSSGVVVSMDFFAKREDIAQLLADIANSMPELELETGRLHFFGLIREVKYIERKKYTAKDFMNNPAKRGEKGR